MSIRTRTPIPALGVLLLGVLPVLGTPIGASAQLRPMPPGLDSAEIARAQGCAVVEAVYAQGQEVGVALQDSLIFMDGLLTHLAETPVFESGSTTDGRAFLTFPAGEGEMARVDTIYAGGDMYPLVSNFRTWRNNNQGRIDSGDAQATQQLQQRRGDLTNYVRSRGQSMLQRLQRLPQVLTDIQLRGQMCTADVALLRTQVVETCDAESVDTQVCQAARAGEPFGSVTFVDSVDQIWALQETNPWEPHTPLTAEADGSVTGASTGAGSRAGNVLLQLSVAPAIQSLEGMEAADVAEFAATLDSLGIAFSDDEYTFVPTLQLRTNIMNPIAGEPFYLLHTGTVADGASIWSAQARGTLVATQIVLSPELIDVLVGTDQITFSAVRVVDEETLEPIWSVPVSSEGRAQAVRALLDYYGTDFAADLDAAAAASAAIGGGGGR